MNPREKTAIIPVVRQRLTERPGAVIGHVTRMTFLSGPGSADDEDIETGGISMSSEISHPRRVAGAAAAAIPPLGGGTVL